MSESEWIVGDVARICIDVVDPANDLPADPGSVVLKVELPNRIIDTYTYPGAITKTGTGKYQCDVNLTAGGRWYLRWETDTPFKGASESTFTVKTGRFN